MKKIILGLRKNWIEIPELVRRFLIRIICIFLIWKVCYHLYLKPNYILDRPLTTLVAKHTILGLQLFYPNSTFKKIAIEPKQKSDFFYQKIYKDNRACIGIADPCNALELYVLYLGFIIALPRNFLKMLMFILFGFVIIYICNIIRCTVIGYLNIERSWSTEVAHHYVFKLIMYVLIFAGWVLYLREKKEIT